MPGAAGGFGDIGFSYSMTNHCDGGARQARAGGRRTPKPAAHKSEKGRLRGPSPNVLPCPG